MKLSMRCRQGVRAIIEIARGYGVGPVKRKTIVGDHNISRGYLENILISLRNHGIVHATRGANGGFALSRPPSKVTLLEVVEALEGPLTPVECLDDPSVCDRIDTCSTRAAWESMWQAKEKALRNVTIQELVDKENMVRESDNRV